MSNDDGFNFGPEDDRTIIRPTPGRRAPRKQEDSLSSISATSEAERAEYAQQFMAIEGSGLNPLVDAASPLFMLMGTIRGTANHDDPEGLRRQFIQEIKRFEKRAQLAGVNRDMLLTARYALSTSVDEAVLNTPWGSSSSWHEETLLSTFHNETWGGEKFFVVLDQTAREPAKNLAALELMFVCLMLGFEGKYRVMERGRAKLEEVQDNLFRLIRRQRGEMERELSPHWHGVEDDGGGLARFVPLWAIAAIALALLMAIYIAFRLALGESTYPIYDALAGIGREGLERPKIEMAVVPDAPPPVFEPEPEPEIRLRLSDLLRAEIEADLLSVDENDERSKVNLHGDVLFASGKTVIQDRYLPVIERVGKSLDQLPGQISVVGHTDNVPIRSLRFNSNWELSRERAVNVMAELAKYISEPGRMTPDGRADTEPVAPNDSPANRALNRRVEITLVEPDQF